MPDISITDFTEFVLRTGPPKITKVSEIFKRGDYDPSHDFWKPLRDCICEFHEGVSRALTFGSTRAHDKKKVRYEEAIAGYQRFLRREHPGWFKPPHARWSFEDLTIRINPEVGFNIGGDSLLVKLYFKQESLTKGRVQVVLALMSSAFKSRKYRVAILDVVRSKLYIESDRSALMEALLKGGGGDVSRYLELSRKPTDGWSIALKRRVPQVSLLRPGNATNQVRILTPSPALSRQALSQTSA